MDQQSIKRTEQLAPIIRMMSVEHPDWKSIVCRIFAFIGLEETSYVLTKRRQDWEDLARSLLPALQDSPVYNRISTILDAIKEQPGTLDEIASRAELHRMTVSQTLNALSRGGYSIQINYQHGDEGAPVKIFSIPD